MALRPLSFGLRLRDKGRTLRVQRDADSYVVEDSRSGMKKRRRKHASAKDAVKDAASTWRSRLN